MDNPEKDITKEELDNLLKEVNQIRRKIIWYRSLFMISLLAGILSATNYYKHKPDKAVIEETSKINHNLLLDDLTSYLTANPWAIDRFKIDGDSLYYLSQKNDSYYLFNVPLKDASKNELKFGEPVRNFIVSDDFIYIQTEFDWGDIEYTEERLENEDTISYADSSLKQINKIYQINKRTGEIIDLSRFVKIKSKKSFSPYVYLELLAENENNLYFLTGNSYQNYGAYTDLCMLDLATYEIKFLSSDIPFETASKSFVKDGKLFIQESIDSGLIDLYSFDLLNGAFELIEQSLDVSQETNKAILEFVSNLK